MSRPHLRDPKLEQLWRAKLLRWSASGLNARDFCRRHHLQESAFYFWRREIAARDRAPVAAPTSDTTSAAPRRSSAPRRPTRSAPARRSEDKYVRVTTGKLPEADYAFLDEVMKASSAILNTLLKILNERTYDAGDGVVRTVPLKLCVAASPRPRRLLRPGAPRRQPPVGAGVERFGRDVSEAFARDRGMRRYKPLDRPRPDAALNLFRPHKEPNMGDTHSWTRATTFPGGAWAKAAADCRRVVRHLTATGLTVQFESDDHAPPEFGKALIRFNGVGEEGHETFLVERHYEPRDWERDRYKRGPWGSFCKIARKPSDAAVCVCLVVLNHHFGRRFVVSSDGDDFEENWPLAREVCQKALGYGRSFSLDERLDVRGPRYGQGERRGVYTEHHFRDIRGRIEVGGPRFYADEEGRFQYAGAGKKVVLYGVHHRTHVYDRLGRFDAPGAARWAAAVNHVGSVANRLGATGYEPFLAKMLAEPGDWLSVNVLCDFLNDQGKDGERLRLVVPASCRPVPGARR